MLVKHIFNKRTKNNLDLQLLYNRNLILYLNYTQKVKINCNSIMKDKILAALRNKYKNLGLGEKVLEGIADMLAITTTEESQIDNAVNGVENLAKGFQSDADRIRTEAAAKAKAEQSKGAEPPKSEPPKEDETPSWAKGLIERLDRIETGKTTESRKSILEAKLKDAAPSVKAKILKDFQRMSFEKDEDFDSYLAETEADLTALNQEFVNQGFSNGHVPQVAGAGATEKAIEADIAAWAAATIPAK